MANQAGLTTSFSTFTCERHRPEETLLYGLIEQHYPRLLEHLEAEGRSLPRFVKDELEVYLKCGRLEHGFFARQVQCLPARAARRVFVQAPRFFARVVGRDG